MKVNFFLTGSMMVLIVMILMFLGLSGCSESTTQNPTSLQGEIKVYVVDSPSDYDAVNIVVTEVSVHMTSTDTVTGWTVISDSLRTINLLNLTNGNFDILGTKMLDAGRYSQIRLKIGTGSNVVVNGQMYPLNIPSGDQSGLKLNHQFNIEANGLYELTLDFDASRSIHVTGNNQYQMRPVIRVVANYISGSISGVVSPSFAFAFVSTIAGSDTISTYANVENGGFKFMVLPAGIYALTIKSGVNTYRDSTITGISVVARQNTNIGTIALRQI